MLILWSSNNNNLGKDGVLFHLQQFHHLFMVGKSIQTFENQEKNVYTIQDKKVQWL
jgi:hypothetical protein